eukprot:TRINITY_DN10436_c0_g3_i3.p1 TRINITY_DN10436_c0_g3~~TRINITY_DN10436_c0_g3_i3.p1  ORF type:complete len:950 (+),score=169.36 TRINITY_DN10436_c0_g3_i3:103-2850(+)
MILKIMFATSIMVGTSATTIAKYYGKECTGKSDRGKSDCPELVLWSNATSFDVSIFASYCGDECVTTCSPGFTEQKNFVGECELMKSVWHRETKVAPNCTDQPDFTDSHNLNTQCIQEYTLVSPTDNMFVTIPVYTIADDESISRLKGYICPALVTATLRDTIVCVAYAYGPTSLTTFDDVGKLTFSQTPSGVGTDYKFVEVDGELIRIQFDFKLGPNPVDNLELDYELTDHNGKQINQKVDVFGGPVTTLPHLQPTTSSVAECDSLGNHHTCTVTMRDDIGPVDWEVSAFDFSVTDYSPVAGCTIAVSNAFDEVPGAFSFNVSRSGQTCGGTQNAVVNVLINKEQIMSPDGIKEGITITDVSTPAPAPVTPAPPALTGHTNALYKEGNTKWGCQSSSEYLNISCNPIVRKGSTSAILVELYKDECPSDASCQISCPGGTTTMTVLQGPCTSQSDIPWGKASRGKPCDAGSPPQPDFVTGNIRTSGCITQWRLVDSFGGLIMFNDFDISSSETTRLGLIDCPGIDDAILRETVKCTAYSWGDSQLTSFDSSQFRFVSMETSMGGAASNPQVIAVQGQRIMLEFDYTIQALPTDASTEFRYAVHYHKSGKDAVYPTRSQILSTVPHRVLPTMSPGVESTIRCVNVTDFSSSANFLHTCTVVTLDSVGPLNAESLTDFNLTITVGEHPRCAPTLSNFFDIVPGTFKFNVSRSGDHVCNGDVMTVISMMLDGEYITTWNKDGDKVREPVVIDDIGPPVPKTDAPPTHAPPTAVPTAEPTAAPPTPAPPTRSPYTMSPPTAAPEEKSNKAEMVYGTLAIITGILFIVALTYLLVRNRQKQIAGTFSIIGNGDNGGNSEYWQGTVPIYEDEGPSTQLQDFSPHSEEGYVAPGSLADDGPLILNEATNQNIQDGNDYTVAE